ncbi:MAG: Mut7-C RNAse domain-containing protein, partial [Acidobacteriota bacterium]
MRFAVDCMLGKLAKWLKILGFDVFYDCRVDDHALLERVRREKRVLLTKDHGLLDRSRGIQTLFIESDRWEDQLRQTLDSLRLRPLVRPHSRCLQCNVGLKSLPKQRAKNLVAPFVYERAKAFALCPSCGRVFWRGTHFDDMTAKLEKILAKPRLR